MISVSERKYIRELAKEVAEIAALPVMAERRGLWKLHNSMKPARPMLLVFPEGAWREILPASGLCCEGAEARNIEFELKSRIFYHKSITDDTVIENIWNVQKRVNISNWQPSASFKPSGSANGAWGFDPVLHGFKDLEKFSESLVTCDAEGTTRDFQYMQELFGDILDVRLRGVRQIAYHLMFEYTRIRGLEQAMWDMADEPELIHSAMNILVKGHEGILRQYIEQNLLDTNNDGTYHSSGGVGYTAELPKEAFNPAKVRPIDMWASAESQEMAQVSPEMHYEFVMQYEQRLLEPFGLTGYGCCDDLTLKLGNVLQMPNIRRVSISPWADVERCAEKLGGAAIFSWKPNPAHLAGFFDEGVIAKSIKHTLDTVKNGPLEIILKDTHTCANKPERFTKWSGIAQAALT